MQDLKSTFDICFAAGNYGGSWKTLAGMSSDEINIFLVLREYWEAYRLQDPVRMEAILDEEYADGEGLDKAQYVATTGTHGVVISGVDIDYQNAVVHITGNRAVVQYFMSFIVEHPSHRARHLYESIDVFLKRHGVWRVYRGTYDEARQSVQLVK